MYGVKHKQQIPNPVKLGEPGIGGAGGGGKVFNMSMQTQNARFVLEDATDGVLIPVTGGQGKHIIVYVEARSTRAGSAILANCNLYANGSGSSQAFRLSKTSNSAVTFQFRTGIMTTANNVMVSDSADITKILCMVDTDGDDHTIYIDGVENIVSDTINPGIVMRPNDCVSIGNFTNGDLVNGFEGELGEFWITDEVVDLSTVAKRDALAAMFCLPDGTQVDKGLTGALPTGSEPALYMPGNATDLNHGVVQGFWKDRPTATATMRGDGFDFAASEPRIAFRKVEVLDDADYNNWTKFTEGVVGGALGDFETANEQPLAFAQGLNFANTNWSRGIAGVTLPSGSPVEIEIIQSGHFQTGDEVLIDNCEGSVELNANIYTITVVDGTNVTLDGTDGDDFTAWTSGGNISDREGLWQNFSPKLAAEFTADSHLPIVIGLHGNFTGTSWPFYIRVYDDSADLINYTLFKIAAAEVPCGDAQLAFSPAHADSGVAESDGTLPPGSYVKNFGAGWDRNAGIARIEIESVNANSIWADTRPSDTTFRAITSITRGKAFTPVLINMADDGVRSVAGYSTATETKDVLTGGGLSIYEHAQQNGIPINSSLIRQNIGVTNASLTDAMIDEVIAANASALASVEFCTHGAYSLADMREVTVDTSGGSKFITLGQVISDGAGGTQTLIRIISETATTQTLLLFRTGGTGTIFDNAPATITGATDGVGDYTANDAQASPAGIAAEVGYNMGYILNHADIDDANALHYTYPNGGYRNSALDPEQTYRNIIQGLQSLGMLTARGTNGWGVGEAGYIADAPGNETGIDFLNVFSYSWENRTTHLVGADYGYYASHFIPYVLAIGGVFWSTFHGIVKDGDTPAATQAKVSDIETILDAQVAAKADGFLKVLEAGDAYAQLVAGGVVPTSSDYSDYDV